MVKCFVRCATCILECIEKICDYINTAAYCYIAVVGGSFCTGAWEAFLLNVKHLLKFAFSKFLANVFIFLGKVALTVANCFSLIFIMKYITKDMDEISSIWGPVSVVAIISFLTASIFLGLFDTAVMSMMTCLAIDMDNHNGTPAKGPKTFHDGLSNEENIQLAAKFSNKTSNEVV
jgi:hypothetical protein